MPVRSSPYTPWRWTHFSSGGQHYRFPAIFLKHWSFSLLEDLERNDGSEQKPYYMSKGLR